MRVRSWLAADSGTTVVEFALVAPIVILVLVVCLDFARAANAYVIVSNASIEGARDASAQSTQLTAGAIETYVEQRIAPLDPSGLTVTRTYVPTSDPRWAPGAPAPWTVTVRVQYAWSAATAMTGAFFSLVGGSHMIDVSSSMETIQ